MVQERGQCGPQNCLVHRQGRVRYLGRTALPRRGQAGLAAPALCIPIVQVKMRPYQDRARKGLRRGVLRETR
jgi:hypothetical protein